MLRYTREIAFAAAEVYAQAAEARGAWDARLESLVVDALLRGEVDDVAALRAAALGWARPRRRAWSSGRPGRRAGAVVDECRRTARRRHRGSTRWPACRATGWSSSSAASTDPLPRPRALVGQFGAGPVVVGPVVPDLPRPAAPPRPRCAGLRAAAGLAGRPAPGARRRPARRARARRRRRGPRPAGRGRLRPLVVAGTALLETVSAYLEQAGSLEGAARLLFVHPNTVRYRLRRVTDLTGVGATTARGAFVMRLALGLGRLAEAADRA